VIAGKAGARGWRDAGDCSSDDGVGGDDGGLRVNPNHQVIPDPNPKHEQACRKRWWFRTGTEGRDGGLSAVGAALPSVLGCDLGTIVQT